MCDRLIPYRHPSAVVWLPGATQPINLLAFACALIGGPLIVALALFWAIIPLFALEYGFLPYVLLGTPVGLFMLSRGYDSLLEFALAGFAGNMFLFALWWVWNAIAGHGQAGLIFMLFLPSAVFAPLWSIAAACLYAKLQHYPVFSTLD